MPSDSDLAFTPAYQLRELIAQKQVSPVELTEASLRRIEALNPRLNAFLTVTADAALASAREAEQAVQRGDALGPLHGVPTSFKDLAPTKGVRTTRGSLAYDDWVPDYDDIVVERTIGAGAVSLGKTNTPEFGLSATTENRLGDDCRNPWDTGRTSGGSSGGAAASVAAGISSIAQGSDGGGSIRIPSGLCGVYGIKPTQGRVPRRDTGSGSWFPVNFSCQGPIARTVRDAAIFLQVMAGPHPEAETLTIAGEPPDYVAALDRGVRGLRVAWSPALGSAAVDPEVRESAARAAQVFDELGASVEEEDLELDVDHLRAAYGTIRGPKYVLDYGELLDRKGDLLMPATQQAIERGKGITGVALVEAMADLQRFRATVEEFFTRYDLLLTPSLATPAFPCGEAPTVIDGRQVNPRMGFTPFTLPFNMAGNPAASVPCGFSSGGLPIGLHIVGRWGDEAPVLAASAAFEEVRPWAAHRPPVAGG